MAKQQTIRETAALTATPIAGKPGRLLVELITPGQGSSGTYSPEVLEAAAADNVFPAGTQMYLDHPTETEQYERPERSVKDLGAVLVEAARWDPASGADGALVAEADVFSQHRELLAEMQSHIGVSVRAAAEVSEAKGARTIERLVASASNTVDFVTRAGRGGSFTVLESARPGRVNERALKHDSVTEATVNDQREALADLIKSTHGADKTYVWLRDFDDTTAWFEISTDDSEQTFAQSYTTGDNDLADALTGERAEVRQVTNYVPVTPVGQSTTQESSGGHMAKIQIEESEHTRLTETAGRVTALESERNTWKTRAEEAEGKVQEFEATEAENARDTRARELVNEAAKAAEVVLNELELDGLVSGLPIKESALDEDAFTTKVKAKLTALAESGRVRGFGSTAQESGVISADDFDAEFTKEA